MAELVKCFTHRLIHLGLFFPAPIPEPTSDGFLARIFGFACNSLAGCTDGARFGVTGS